MAQQPPLRAGDADGERVIALLRQAVGRRAADLVEELADRVEEAQEARTYDELRAIVADLMPGGRLPPRRRRRSHGG